MSGGGVEQTAEIDSSVMLCAFALHGGRYCTRRAGHTATDGRVARHDSTANEHHVHPTQLAAPDVQEPPC